MPGLTAGNATDRIQDFTGGEGGPILKNKLWFYVSGRYYSVNNFIAQTFTAGRQTGRRRSVHQEHHGADHLADQPAQQVLRVQRRDRQVPRSRHAGAVRSRHRRDRLELAGVSHEPGEVDVDRDQQADDRRRVLEQPRVLHERISRGHREAARYRRTGSPTRRDPNSDLGGRKTAATVQFAHNPARYNMQAAATYVTGSHNIKVGFQRTWGTFTHSYDANADLTQQYRSNATGIPYTVPNSVVIRNTPLATVRRALNYDLGIFAQDAWTMKRLTINAGHPLGSAERAGAGGRSPAGRFVPARHFDADREPAELERLGAAVQRRLRPVRQREDGVEVLAQPLQPAAHDRHRRQLQPAGVGDVASAWRGPT